MPAQGWWRGPPAHELGRAEACAGTHSELRRAARRRGRAAEEVALAERRPEALDAVVVGGGALGLACAWRAARARPAGSRARARPPGRRSLPRRRGHARSGGRGELGRGGVDAPRAGLGPSLARLRRRARRRQRAGGRLRPLRRPPRRARSRRGRGAAPPLRADGLARPRRGVAAPARCGDLEPGLAPACAAGVHAPAEAAVDPRLLVLALAPPSSVAAARCWSRPRSRTR